MSNHRRDNGSLVKSSEAGNSPYEELKTVEQRYEAAFEYTGTGMMILERDMTISLINQKMCELTGYTKEEVEGKKKWTELVSESDIKRMEEYHRLRREGSEAPPSQYEFRYNHRDGSLHNALITVSMIPESNQSLVSMMDITEIKETEQQLIESQKRFKETADLLPGIICEINTDLKFIYVNELGLKLSGYTEEEFRYGIELKDIIHKEDQERVLENANRVIKGENVGPQEYRLVHKDGEIRHYLVDSARLLKEGKPAGLRTCLMDITEMKEMEKKISESEERLRTIYSGSPIGIALFNAEGEVIDLNTAFKKMSGIPEETDYRKLNFRLFNDVKEIKGAEAEIIEKGGINFESNSDFRFVRSGDIYEFVITDNRYLNWYVTPLSVKHGKASMYLAQIQDITERKRHEREKLHQARVDAEKANKMIEGLKKEIYQGASFQNMVSRSPAMQKVFNILPEVSQVQTTLLITGESGTGKELVAGSVHELSPRKNGPFTAVNCGALPDNLLESELFGYKKGAFTDAKKDKPGKFAQAENGTIFLDEIGDISPAMQVKLLRVLQEKVYEPLGSTESVEADVRIIAATNRNLPEMVKKGEFRQDLYYRIKVLTIDLPPLRKRKSDIPLLCRHFISIFNSRYKKSIKEVSDRALNILLSHDYPGNIRELENILEHSSIFCRGSIIEPEHLPSEISESETRGSAEEFLSDVGSLDELEAKFIKKVLDETSGSRKEAAQRLGIHKATLFRKMNKLGIKGV